MVLSLRTGARACHHWPSVPVVAAAAVVELAGGNVLGLVAAAVGESVIFTTAAQASVGKTDAPLIAAGGSALGLSGVLAVTLLLALVMMEALLPFPFLW